MFFVPLDVVGLFSSAAAITIIEVSVLPNKIRRVKSILTGPAGLFHKKVCKPLTLEVAKILIYF